MARDRKRAKRRKEKRQPSPPSRQDGESAVPDARPLHRENVPGSVEHTGEVDKFEAELVAGAGGEPELDDQALEQAALEAEAEAALGREPGTSAAGATAAPVPHGEGESAPTQDARGRGGMRFANFLRASWAELQRVRWPDRRATGQATAVVLGFCLLAGFFLGVADWAASQLVNLII